MPRPRRRAPRRWRCPRQSFPGENAARDGDVFAPGVLRGGDRLRQRALVAHLGELDQHGKIDAGEHLDLGTAHDRDREVRGRAAEHVGEDGDPFARVHALDRLDDVVAALLDVVVGIDGHRLDLGLRPHHMLKRRAELEREPPVRDENETDHRAPCRRTPFAPREKASIMSIPMPRARAQSAFWMPCCIAVNNPCRRPSCAREGYFCPAGAPRKASRPSLNVATARLIPPRRGGWRAKRAGWGLVAVSTPPDRWSLCSQRSTSPEGRYHRAYGGSHPSPKGRVASEASRVGPSCAPAPSRPPHFVRRPPSPAGRDSAAGLLRAASTAGNGSTLGATASRGSAMPAIMVSPQAGMRSASP